MKLQTFVTALLLFVPSAAYSQDSNGPISRPVEVSMTVRIYNYAGIARRELNLAESVATDIFRAGGVQIIWYDCGPSTHADNDPDCSRSTSGTTFNLRICLNCTAFLTSPEHEVRGFATGDTATVSSVWTADLPKTLYVSSELVFGRVIAHELGHLLLGPGHASVGIMKARWTGEDLEPGTLKLLMFTKQQGRLVRSVLKSRASTTHEDCALALLCSS